MPDYITLANFKARYLPDKGTEDDAALSAWITIASRVVDEITQRASWDQRSAVTRVLDGSGIRDLFLSDTVVSLTQVRVRDDQQGAWRVVTLADVLLEPADRRPNEPARWLRITDSPAGSEVKWPKGSRTVELTGSFGYAAVPSFIEEATAEIVVALYRARGSGIEDQGVGDLAQRFVPRALPALAHRLMSMNKPHWAVFA